MSEAFMGVEPDALAALGKVVVAAGRVELVLAHVAEAIGSRNPTGSVSSVIKEVKKAARGRLPAPLQALCPDVIGWVSRLPELFEFRHESVHGVHMKSMDATGQTYPTALLMRRSEHKAVRVEDLEAVAEQLAVRYTEGMNLFGSLHTANLSLKQGRQGDQTDRANGLSAANASPEPDPTAS